MAASDGYLTTKVAAGFYNSEWKITPLGLRHLWALKGMEDES